MLKIRFIFLSLYLLGFIGISQENTVPDKPQTFVQVYAEKLMTYKYLKNAAFSFYAKDMNTGEVIADYNSKMSLPCASVMKLVTTATALQILGSGYRYKTKITYTGSIDSANCVLNGDLHIIGGGDPTLGSKFFNKKGRERDFLYEWADTIKAMGIEKINGRVVADGSIYRYYGAPSGWVWSDMGNYYGAGPNGLTCFDNTLKLQFETGPNAGDSTEIVCTDPYIPSIEIRNYVTAADSKKDNAYVYGAPYSNNWFVAGSIPKARDSFVVKASIPDPELVMALEMDYALEESGIDVVYAPITNRELTGDPTYIKPEVKEIYTHYSPYLGSIINIVNRNSFNLYAEHVLCQLSVNKSGYGSTYNGAQVCKSYWNNKVGAMDLHITDGSGLSRSNAVSAQFLVKMLTYLNGKKAGTRLKESMALAGKRGTMSSMCKGGSGFGRAYGKSGTMTRIKAYAGYVDSKTGKKIAYAMIWNNHNCSTSKIKEYCSNLLNKLASY